MKSSLKEQVFSNYLLELWTTNYMKFCQLKFLDFVRMGGIWDGKEILRNTDFSVAFMPSVLSVYPSGTTLKWLCKYIMSVYSYPYYVTPSINIFKYKTALLSTEQRSKQIPVSTGLYFSNM